MKKENVQRYTQENHDYNINFENILGHHFLFCLKK